MELVKRNLPEHFDGAKFEAAYPGKEFYAVKKKLICPESISQADVDGCVTTQAERDEVADEQQLGKQKDKMLYLLVKKANGEGWTNKEETFMTKAERTLKRRNKD